MKNLFNLFLLFLLVSIGVNSQSFIKDKTFDETIKDLYSPVISDAGWSSYKDFPSTNFKSAIITESNGNNYYQCFATTDNNTYQRALSQYTSQKITTAKYKLTFRARATVGGNFYLKLSTATNVSTWLPTNLTDATPGITLSTEKFIIIEPTNTWQIYSCVFDMAPTIDDYLRVFFTFDKTGTFELDDIDLTLSGNTLVSALQIASIPSGLTAISTPRGTIQLAPVVTPSNATNSKVKWSISDSRIATISDTGLVTAVQNGAVTVTATTLDGSNLTATYTITITGNPLVNKITVTGQNNQKAITAAGGTLQMLADVLPTDAIDKRVLWSVDMPEYATIDSNGLLTAITNGTVVVTATAADLSSTRGTETITITGNAVPAAQTVNLTVKPVITKSIMGHTDFDRAKYINVCHTGSNFESGINNATISNKYINDLEINFGRSLGMVLYADRYTKNLIEDPSRPGFADLNYLKINSKPSNGTTPSAAFSQRFPTSIGTLMHDAHNTYPAFMPKEVYPGSTDSIPVNKVAAGEIVANLLKYNFTDWSRPLSFEPINEPDYTLLYKNYNMLPKLADLHLQIHSKVKEIGAPVMVGGPCASTAWYYGKNYKDFRYFSDFVDATSGKLDFYSFHVYDFYRWDMVNKTLGGRMTTGLPLEGIMDMVSAYGWSKYNKELIYLSTEHGGTMSPTDQKADMRSYFLGSATGFAADMKAKSQTDFLMVNSCIANTFVFMNRPHQVFKVVPFILIESFAWDPKYHASILVANNYNDKTKWYESAQVMFYQYFKNVRGRRILSSCDSPDIQQQSFVDNNKIIILLNNLSDSKITMNLNYPTANLESTMVRRLGRNADFTPYFTETNVADARGLQLSGKESVVLFLSYRDAISEIAKVDEKLYFATEMLQEFSTESTFNIKVSSTANAEYAYLRIGVGRGVGTDRNISVWLNGVQQVVPMEKAAANLEDSSGYGSTKLVQIDKSLLKATNTVKVVFPDNKLGGVGAVTLCVGERISGFDLPELQLGACVPVNNATNQPVTVSPVLKFNKDMDASTLTTSTILISKIGGGTVPAYSISQLTPSTFKITFSQALDLSSEYQFTVKSNVKDLIGSTMARDMLYSFKTLLLPELQPELCNPVNNAVSQPVGLYPVLQFNKDMDASTLTSSAILITKVGGGTVPSYSISALTPNTFKITFSQVLDFNSQYQFTVKSNVKDLSSNTMAADMFYRFTTKSDFPELQPDLCSPINNAVNQPVSLSPVLKFNKDMNASTLTTSTILITKVGGGTVPAYSISPLTSTTFKITFSQALDFNSRYQVTVKSNVKDLIGSTMATDMLYGFTTLLLPELQLDLCSPVNNSVNQPLGLSPVLKFNKDMDVSTLTSSTILITKVGGGTVPAYSISPLTLSTFKITFSQSLDANSQYQVTVKSNVKDLIGSSMATDMLYGFTTASGIYNLGSSNFKISVESASCIGKKTGKISASITNTNYTYQVSVTGVNNYSNTQDIALGSGAWSITGLEKGKYTICFAIASELDQKQCFDVEVTEPDPLSVYAKVDNTTGILDLVMLGGKTYTVTVNGKATTVNSSKFNTVIPAGFNVINVSTDKECQGIYNQEIFVSEKAFIYPNPTYGVLHIFVGGLENSISYVLNDSSGATIKRFNLTVGETREVTVDLSGIPQGNYLININSKTVSQTFKVIKL